MALPPNLSVHDNSKRAALVDGQVSEGFEVSTGVLEGDFLTPFLFIILLSL